MINKKIIVHNAKEFIKEMDAIKKQGIHGACIVWDERTINEIQPGTWNVRRKL